MMNIRDIFNNSEAAAENNSSAEKGAATDRKMYCPSCYKDYFTEKDVCPVCGCKLEEPLSEEEENEYVEILMSTRT